MPPLTEADVRQHLDPMQVIAAIESAFRDRYPRITIPSRTQMSLAGVTFLVMPCCDQAQRTLGMKLVSAHEHPACPEDRIQATYLLLDPETARARITIPANYLTDIRTAATSAVATKHLAPPDVRVLGIFGTGRQARAHLRLLPLVRNFQSVLVCGSDLSRSREFAKCMADELAIPIAPADASTCAAKSDVLCTCTSAQAPLFDGRLLRPGTHLNLVGTFQPHAREVDSVTIQRAQAIVVETHNGALAEAGDLRIPMSEGLISMDIVADLHELLNGKKFAKDSSGGITVFKSVGCALEDLVTAELLATAEPIPT